MQKKYFITTLGCQMNVHESEKIAGMLESLGYTKSTKAISAQVIVFNTCCIREAAENKARSRIGALKNYLIKNPDVILAVGGCMPQQEGAANALIKTFPFIDIVFGTQNLFKFKDFLIKRQKSGKRVNEIETSSPMPQNSSEIARNNSDNAYVNIMYGCNNFCTYCIVPYVRGRERSRPMNEIVEEVKSIVAQQKFKSITLLGQNVNSYGKNLNPPVSFPRLLCELSKISGDFTIKFLTSHPKDCSDELINTIATNPKICRDIHLPVQSGSTKILDAMNRRYSREHYLGLVEKIKKNIPDVRISTDIIVGFPGETEENFQETLSLVRQVGFGNIYAFMYSVRSGTPAAKMEQQVSSAIKRRRINELLALQREIEHRQKGC